MKAPASCRTSCDEVYECVCRSPGIETSSISKRIGIPSTKVSNVLSELKRMGLIEIRKDGGKAGKSVYPVRAIELLPKDMISDLEKVKL